MTVSGIQGTSGYAPEPARKEQTRQGGALGQIEFLQLLVTQLRYQDPLNPIDDREFAAQLAQFSALEQQTEQTRWLQIASGLELVGQQILYRTESGELASGVVATVRIVDGRPVLTVGDSEVSLSQVLEAAPVPTE